MGRHERQARREQGSPARSNGARGNGTPITNATPETEERPVGELTSIAIEQHFAVTNSNAERVASAAARADGVDVKDGWQLDFNGRRWIRNKQQARKAAREVKPDKGEKGAKDTKDTKDVQAPELVREADLTSNASPAGA